MNGQIHYSMSTRRLLSLVFVLIVLITLALFVYSLISHFEQLQNEQVPARKPTPPEMSLFGSGSDNPIAQTGDALNASFYRTAQNFGTTDYVQSLPGPGNGRINQFPA